MGLRNILLMLAALSLAFGCAGQTAKVEQPTATATPVAVVKEAKMKTVVKGKVLDGFSRPMKDVRIEAKGAVCFKQRCGPYVKTRSDGTYTFRLPPGEHTIICRWKSGIEKKVTVELGKTISGIDFVAIRGD